MRKFMLGLSIAALGFVSCKGLDPLPQKPLDSDSESDTSEGRGRKNDLSPIDMDSHSPQNPSQDPSTDSDSADSHPDETSFSPLWIGNHAAISPVRSSKYSGIVTIGATPLFGNAKSNQHSLRFVSRNNIQ